MKRFKNWLEPPTFEGNTEKTITAGLLNSILFTMLVGPIVFSISAILNQENPTRSLTINITTFLFLCSLLVPLRKGYVKQAVVGTIIIMFTIFTLVATMHSGVSSPAFNGLILVVMIAGLLLGKRPAFITAFLGVCIGLLLHILNGTELIPFANSLQLPEISTWIILSVFLGISAVFVGMSRSMTNKALLEIEQRLVEQQAAQNALRASEGTVRALFETLPDVIFRIDRSGTFIDYIPAKDFDTLVPPEEFLGRKLEDVLPSELAELTQYYITRALDENLVQTYEYSLQSEDGLHYFESRMVKTETDSVLAIVREVTTRINAKQMNEEVLEVLERRNTQLRIAAEVAKTCSSILDPDILVQQAVDLIQRGFNLYYVGLYSVDSAGQAAILIAGSGETGKNMLADGHHLQLETPSMISWCIRNGKARIAQQADLDKVRYRNPHLPETRSELALPLISRGRVIGALTVQDVQEGAFSEGDISSLQTMADQLGTAVENANLFEETQQEIKVRRAIEKKLRVSEQKFSKAFRSSPDSVTLTELESGHLIEVNDGFRGVFGYSREEALGRTTLDLGLYQNPSDRQKMVQILREQGNIRNMELIGVHKSGSVLTALLSVEQIKISGKPHLVTITRDITEHKKAEETLRLNEERYRTLAQNLPDSALLLFNQDLRFIIADGPEIDATGFSREMLEGKTLQEALPSEFAQLVGSNMRRTLAGEKFYAELPYEDRFYKYSYVPLRDNSGNVGMGMILATNITERKYAEKERERLFDELETKNAELERFTYTVSHDLKSPLITIRGFLGYLEKDAVEGNIERLTNDIERISKAAEKMQQLLDELLELSRIGRLINEPEGISFETIAREAISLVEGQLKDSNIKVKIGSNLPKVYGDRVRLVEVIQNLVDNAAKFTKGQSNPKIEVGAHDDDGETTFYVKDNGIGIDPKYHRKIFGLFDKLDPSSDGTGVGLALVKRIVEVHGGRIWVESEAGKGATFYFTLNQVPST